MSILIKVSNPRHRKLIESWLKRICPSVRVNLKGLVEWTGKEQEVLSATAACGSIDECQTLYLMIRSKRVCRIEPRVAHGSALKHPYPGTYPDEKGAYVPLNGAGGAAISSTSRGFRKSNSPTSDIGVGADVRLYLDLTDNFGEGYTTSNYPWVRLKHMLGSGLAYQFMNGQAAPSRLIRRAETIACENAYREKIGLQPRSGIDLEDPELSEELEAEEIDTGFKRVVDVYDDTGVDTNEPVPAEETLPPINETPPLPGETPPPAPEPVPGNDKKLIVIVPGIMGSELYDENQQRVWLPKLTYEVKYDLQLGLRIVIRLASDLSHLYPGKPKRCGYSGKPGARHGALLGHSYAGLIAFLESRKYKLGEKLFTFAYDWTLENSYTSQKLEAYLESIYADNPDATSISIICHSMGSYSTRELLQRKGPITQKIDKVVYVGAPHYGAPLAYCFVHPGINSNLLGIPGLRGKTVQYLILLLLAPGEGPWKELPDSDPYKDRPLKHFARSTPSVIELMPTQRYLNMDLMLLLKTGDKLDRKPNRIRDIYYRNISPGKGDDYAFDKSIHPAIEKGQAYNNSLPAKLAQPHLNVYSRHKATINRVDYERGAKAFAEPYADPKTGHGDETVPTASSLTAGQNNALVDGAHATLCNVGNFHLLLKKYLNI